MSTTATVSGISIASVAALVALLVNIDKLQAYWPVTQSQFAPVQQSVSCLECMRVCTNTCARNGVPAGQCNCTGCDPVCSQ